VRATAYSTPPAPDEGAQVHREAFDRARSALVGARAKAVVAFSVKEPPDFAERPRRRPDGSDSVSRDAMERAMIPAWGSLPLT
jgi:hypothetical protein